MTAIKIIIYCSGMVTLAQCIAGYTPAVMLAHKKQGIEEAYVKLLEDICSESTTAIKQLKKGEEFPLILWVDQGNTEYEVKCIFVIINFIKMYRYNVI